MRYTRLTGSTLAALLVAACGANQKHVSAEQRARQAEQERQEAQEDARKARVDADKAREQAQEAMREQREAEENAQFARQRAAQAEMQAARERQDQVAPRTGATERQADYPAARTGATRETILFQEGSMDLSSDAKDKLDAMAKAIRADERAHRVTVEGYTGDTGEHSVNVQASRRRAEQVADYLESKGVAKERIVTRALGSDNPASKEETSRGRALNRRVEVSITPPVNLKR